MTIYVNGQPHESAATTARDLVTELDIAPELLLLEHNSTALLRSEWETTPLAPNDRIELLRVAAGG